MLSVPSTPSFCASLLRLGVAAGLLFGLGNTCFFAGVKGASALFLGKYCECARAMIVEAPVVYWPAAVTKKLAWFCLSLLMKPTSNVDHLPCLLAASRGA